jgi:HAD superfamily hydrolase (TIGR01490 family)
VFVLSWRRRPGTRARAARTTHNGRMDLALFDLDNTLLDGDSDLLWSELLAEEGALDVEPVRRWHADYHAGTLDIDAFLRFQLEPLRREPIERLLAWRERFVAERVRPRLGTAARALVREHEGLGHTLALITATNAFLTEPIARELAIPHLIATRPEVVEGRYTGEVEGSPCFREGKVLHLERWLAERGGGRSQLRESWFYSDSHNDLPLLSAVDHPVAVDPDPRLAARAHELGWTVLSLARHDRAR